MLNFRFASAH